MCGLDGARRTLGTRDMSVLIGSILFVGYIVCVTGFMLIRVDSSHCCTAIVGLLVRIWLSGSDKYHWKILEANVVWDQISYFGDRVQPQCTLDLFNALRHCYLNYLAQDKEQLHRRCRGQSGGQERSDYPTCHALYHGEITDPHFWFIKTPPPLPPPNRQHPNWYSYRRYYTTKKGQLARLLLGSYMPCTAARWTN